VCSIANRRPISLHPEAYVHGGHSHLRIVLVDIVVYNCPRCGAIVPEIQNVDALHSAIALNLLKKNGVLVAEEIRFLRSMADYSATHLAKVMGVAKQTLSRWENAKAVIGIESDRLLRFACLAGIGKLERLALLILPESSSSPERSPAIQ